MITNSTSFHGSISASFCFAVKSSIWESNRQQLGQGQRAGGPALLELVPQLRLQSRDP